MTNIQVSNQVVNDVVNAVKNIKELICSSPFDINITIESEHLSYIDNFADLYRTLQGFAFMGFTVFTAEGTVDLVIRDVDMADNIILVNQSNGQLLILNKFWKEVYSGFGYTNESLSLIISSIPEH